jgi:TrmH family RNA methyltransferase
MFLEASIEEKEKIIREKCYDKCRFSGKSAAAVKLVQAVQNNSKSNPQRLVAVEGIWECGLLIRYMVDIKSVFLNMAGITSLEAYELVQDLIRYAEEVHIVSESTFAKMAEVGTSAGMLVLARFPQKKLLDLDSSKAQAVVVLDGLEIPGNIGTIIRSCDGTDTNAVIICNRKTRLSHPKMIRSSQGSCFKVPIVEEETTVLIDWLQRNDYRIILTDTRSKQYYFEANYKGKIAIIMGSERYGISRDWYDIEAEMIKIPMFGDSDSLNVGIAATIILYESAIQRKGLLKRF